MNLLQTGVQTRLLAHDHLLQLCHIQVRHQISLNIVEHVFQVGNVLGSPGDVTDILMREALLAVEFFLHVVVEFKELIFVNGAALVSGLVAYVRANVVLQQLHVQHSVALSAQSHIVVFAVHLCQIWTHQGLLVRGYLLLAVKVLVAGYILLDAVHADRAKLFRPAHVRVEGDDV